MKIITDSFHLYDKFYLFEEIRININKHPLLYALVVLLYPFTSATIFLFFLFFVYYYYYYFSCSSQLFCLRQEPCLLGLSLCHGCLAQFLAQVIGSVIFAGWMYSHFIKEWIIEKWKYVLKFTETEPESISYISGSYFPPPTPLGHIHAVCLKW